MPSPASENFAITEDPDLVVWRLSGHVSADDVRRIFDLQARFCAGKPYAFVLIDVHRVEHFSPGARRVAAEGPDEGRTVLPIRANAVVGASFHIRVLGTMVSRAAAFLNAANSPPVRFFDAETEARAWLAELRRDLRNPAH